MEITYLCPQYEKVFAGAQEPYNKVCVCVCVYVCVCVCLCVCVVSCAYTMPCELVEFKAHIHDNANIHRNRFRGTMIGENSLTHYPAKTQYVI